MRRARVRGSVGAISSPSSDPGLEKELRRSRVGEWVVPKDATGAQKISGVARCDVFSAISGFGLRGSKTVVEPVRE